MTKISLVTLSLSLSLSRHSLRCLCLLFSLFFCFSLFSSVRSGKAGEWQSTSRFTTQVKDGCTCCSVCSWDGGEAIVCAILFASVFSVCVPTLAGPSSIAGAEVQCCRDATVHSGGELAGPFQARPLVAHPGHELPYRSESWVPESSGRPSRAQGRLRPAGARGQGEVPPSVHGQKKCGKVLHTESSCRYLAEREALAMDWCSRCMSCSAKCSKIA